MAVQQLEDRLVAFTTPERVQLARRTHRAVKRGMWVAMGVLAAVILLLGALLSRWGAASFWGCAVVSAAFLAVAGCNALYISRIERRAERFLADDGATQFVVGADAITVGGLTIPYARITMMIANTALESYSSGGMRGERMASRMDLAEDRPGIGRGIGALIGTGQRRRLYRDGAKSGIELLIGVDRKAELGAPEGMINPLRSLPRRGDDPGRIDMPFGAYLDERDLHAVLGAVSRADGSRAFPLGVVTGAVDWASAATAACETREQIWKDAASLEMR